MFKETGIENKMIILGYIFFSMLLIRFLVVLINYVSHPFLNKAKQPYVMPFVSVLIPARNEEENLPLLLNDLAQLNYPNFEVLVCNDQSIDKTEEIIQQFQVEIKLLSYFNNETLPKGWVGKNYACHKLSMHAKGEYMVFVDADVRVQPNLIHNAISFTKHHKLKLLSIFPKQLVLSKGEWKTVPLMNWILLTFLPLALVRLRWFSSVSAANGQFMLFDAENYRQNLWHEKVKNFNVDDILIARLMKKRKYKIAVLLGRNDVACRMYKSYDAAINGFSLNVHQYFNNSRLWLIFFLSMFWFRLPFFVLTAQYYFLGISIVLIVFMKLLYSNLSGFELNKSYYFHFYQMIALTKIVFKNLKNKYKRKFEWKGRFYSQ